MKFADFANKTRNISYFKTEALVTLAGNRRTIYNQLVAWQRQGKVHQLKRGIYTLNDIDRRAPLPTLLISNILYGPSYVSLESALGYFGLIPERVVQVTAATPRKTAAFKNFYGGFIYQSIKDDCFFGFQSVTLEEGVPVLMAMPEKAVLDKVYFDTAFRPDEGYFLDNLRLQNYELLNRSRLERFARRFGTQKVRKGATILADLVRKEKRGL